MTDQELIKALRYCGSSDEKSCRDCPAVKECHGSIGIPTATIAADRLEALLAENERLKAQMPKWVSVEERLPTMHAETYDDIDGPHKFWRSGTVLGADRAGTVYAVWCEQSMYGGTFWVDEPGNIYEITNWQPLPEPPSTEGVE